MLIALRQRDFALLWTAGLISLAGDKVLALALPFFVYTQTGSALATGTMFIAQALPSLLLSAVAGVLVDRTDRRRLLVLADLLRGSVLLLLLTVRSVEYLWIVYLVAALESAISQFAGPAKSALVPSLVSESDLVAANALNAQAKALTNLVAPALGGALLGLFGLGSVALVDTASYLASAVLTARIKAVPPVVEVPDGDVTTRVVSAWSKAWYDWKKGCDVVGRRQDIGALFAAMGLVMLAQGVLNVIWIIFVTDVLHGSALDLGLLAAAGGIGILIGGFVVDRASKRVAVTQILWVGAGLSGLLFLMMARVALVDAALAFNVLLYVPVVAFLISHQTLLQSSVPDDLRGRVFGFLATINALLVLSGLGIASLLASWVGAATLLGAAGCLWVFASLLARARLVAVRHRRDVVPARE